MSSVWFFGRLFASYIVHVPLQFPCHKNVQSLSKLCLVSTYFLLFTFGIYWLLIAPTSANLKARWCQLFHCSVFYVISYHSIKCTYWKVTTGLDYFIHRLNTKLSGAICYSDSPLVSFLNKKPIKFLISTNQIHYVSYSTTLEQNPLNASLVFQNDFRTKPTTATSFKFWHQLHDLYFYTVITGWLVARWHDVIMSSHWHNTQIFAS